LLDNVAVELIVVLVAEVSERVIVLDSDVVLEVIVPVLIVLVLLVVEVLVSVKELNVDSVDVAVWVDVEQITGATISSQDAHDALPGRAHSPGGHKPQVPLPAYGFE
jgi:hypothetical protein